jgi:NAD(P)-dependent dehydrogenase (short-subunit alcohol dehydrogenase family)
MQSSTGRKVALVTGAADGLGAGAADRLLRDGWAVLLFDLNPAVSKTADMLREKHDVPRELVMAEVGDVTSVEQVTAAVIDLTARHGRIDLTVANAGVAGEGVPIYDMTPDDFLRVTQVNLFGVYLTCHVAAARMKEQGSGSLITTSSIFGVEPVAGAAAYCASKAGVIALTKTMALDLAPYGVRVNSIAPGYMRTEMQWEAIRQKAELSGRSFNDERLEVVGMLPLARHGEPSDFGAAVAFLASDDASYITGHTLGVTGGVVNW